MAYEGFVCFTLSMCIILLGSLSGRPVDAKEVAVRDTQEDIADIKLVTELIRNVTTEKLDYGLVKRSLMGLGIAAKAFKTFAFLGAQFHALGAFLPNPAFAAIKLEFQKLTNKLDNVAADVKQLEAVIHWEATKQTYAAAKSTLTEMNRLDNAMLKAVAANDSGLYDRMKQDLIEYCKDHECFMAIKNLLAGVNMNGIFHNNILDSYYDLSGGHRPNMMKLINRLEQLIIGGVAAYQTYIAAKKGHIATGDYLEDFDTWQKAANVSMQAILQRCMDEYAKNMKDDMGPIHKTDGLSNQQMARRMFDALKPKYDFLDLAVLVYYGTDNYEWLHGLRGSSRVEIVSHVTSKGTHHPKNVIVFNRWKEASKATNKVNKANEIAAYPQGFSQNSRANTLIADVAWKCSTNRVPYFGIALVRRGKQAAIFDYIGRYSGDPQLVTEWSDYAFHNGDRWATLILVGNYK